jgi:hypothetical protein
MYKARQAWLSPPKRKLDTVVKLGLGVLFGSFTLIFAGMFLSRPDRSIPPYSIGSQEGRAVAVHVPSWTSDAAIEALIDRFGKVGRETQDFGKMKIQPTTSGDPVGPYRRISIYIFTDAAWAEPDVLHRYLNPSERSREDQSLREAFEKAVRGLYRLDEFEQEGRIYARVLFKERVGSTSSKPR